MKFFITFKSSLLPVVPYEKEAEKARKGMEAWLKNPRVVADYQLVGTRDSISIWEGSSLEQLHIDIFACPSHRLGEWTITPVLDNREPGEWKSKMVATEALRGNDEKVPSLAGVSLSSQTCQVA